jgi:hypothetical protein
VRLSRRPRRPPATSPLTGFKPKSSRNIVTAVVISCPG